MIEQQGSPPELSQDQLVGELGGILTEVGDLVATIRADQWAAPTPCTDWTVQRLVSHVIGMNRVFVALLTDAPRPRPDADHRLDDPVGAYRESAAGLLAAFSEPAVLERQFQSPMGVATGAERLQIRLYDLLAHGWDLAQATGQTFDPPDDVVERSLAAVRVQLADRARPGRFAAAQPVADDAPAIDRLVAFLGRSVT